MTDQNPRAVGDRAFRRDRQDAPGLGDALVRAAGVDQQLGEAVAWRKGRLVVHDRDRAAEVVLGLCHGRGVAGVEVEGDDGGRRGEIVAHADRDAMRPGRGDHVDREGPREFPGLVDFAFLHQDGHGMLRHFGRAALPVHHLDPQADLGFMTVGDRGQGQRADRDRDQHPRLDVAAVEEDFATRAADLRDPDRHRVGGLSHRKGRQRQVGHLG